MTAPGRIITFYSYKGGTRRSMALANVAWVLASNGHRVLVIDWDLEAPGLHRYFHPFLVDREVTGTEGVIDLFTRFSIEAMTPSERADEDWFRPLADFSRYAVSLDWQLFPKGATLDFVPAGLQGQSYASRVNSFDWRDFYERLGGGAFIDEAKRRLREEYDYVLIDSRTGVSDTAGIGTVHLPDVLAVCFTLNIQAVLVIAASLSDRAARHLTSTLYRELARGVPIDQAVRNARLELTVYAEDWSSTFGLPVLVQSNSDPIVTAPPAPDSLQSHPLPAPRRPSGGAAQHG
jgi:hypothetical protein